MLVQPPEAPRGHRLVRKAWLRPLWCRVRRCDGSATQLRCCPRLLVDKLARAHGDTDGRLLPKERVVAVSIGDVDAAFPFSILEEERVISYNLDDQDIVVFFNSATTSALDGRNIKNGREVGAAGG